VDSPKGCPMFDASEGDWEDKFWLVTSSEWSWGESESGSHQDYWGNPIRVMAPNVGPKVTMQRGVIWPRDSLLPGGRGREPRERKRRASA
jgi:hypothetical protein